MAVVSIEEPICLLCKHLLEQQPRDDVWVCSVFPKGIPNAIWNNEHDHRLPFAGDGGTQFEPIQSARQQIEGSRAGQGKQRGGKDSGYHVPHKGRPGQVGGSLPRDELAVIDYTEDVAFSTAANKGWVVSSSPLGNGYCRAEILEYADDGSGIWKQLEIGGYGGHSGFSEVAAYRLSELLGMDIVPETVFAFHDGMKGTVQRFIPNVDIGETYLEKLMNEWNEGRWESLDQLHEAMWSQHGERIKQTIVLDYIIGNRDRHNGNWVVDADGRFWAVDHGHSAWYRTPLWDVGSTVNNTLVRILYRDERNLSVPYDTLKKWKGITREEWDKTFDGLVDDTYVNHDNAWRNFQNVVEAGELDWVGQGDLEDGTDG